MISPRASRIASTISHGFETFLQIGFAVAAFAALSSASRAQDPTDVSRPAMAAAVWVEKLDASGNSLKRSSGFVVKDGRVATSFRSIDGATTLKLIFPDGKEIKTDQIAGFNRDQGWAMIPIKETGYAPLTVPAKKNWNVGDHCYWMEVKADGSRSLAEGTITGLPSARPWGDRIDFSGKFTYAALGGPLLDAKGNVIGLLGGAMPDAYLHAGAAH